MYRERPARMLDAEVWHAVAEGPEGSPQRVLPDGCMDLIRVADTLLVAGPDTSARLAFWPPGVRFTGLRFLPGVAPAVLGAPACELRDRLVPLEEVWPEPEARRLSERLAESAVPGAVLEETAARRLSRADPIDPRVREIVRLVRSGASVRATAEAVGMSERRLHRRCLAAFGYGPKTLGRILRMGRALDLIRQAAPPAAAAASAGYADQAHLTREVKALAGVPPRALIP